MKSEGSLSVGIDFTPKLYDVCAFFRYKLSSLEVPIAVYVDLFGDSP